jgi:hypothetical protein
VLILFVWIVCIGKERIVGHVDCLYGKAGFSRAFGIEPPRERCAGYGETGWAAGS